MNNTQLYNLAKSYLGKGGSIFRSYCGLGSGSPWCNAFVTYVFHKGGDALLYCDGKKQTYCPTSIKWCYNNLAQIPIYLAMPMDVIYFDWELNGTPNHIGFVRQRKSDQEIDTIEGNTSGGIVANKVRTVKYVQAVFRPHFHASFDVTKPLVIDGKFDYSSVAMLQLALGCDVTGILTRYNIKVLQKIAGVTQDGSWGKNTTKALQKMLGVKVDGAWGVESTKALQKWINSKAKPQATPQPTPTIKPADGKLIVDGKGGTATVKAMQRFFDCSQDGVISGQNESLKRYYPALEAVEFGKNGSVCITRLQRWVGANEDGILGQITVKLWQKKIGVKEDGYFGAESMRVWQKYLNENDKVVYPPKPTPTPTPTPSKTVYIGQACADYDHKAGDSSGKEVTKSAFQYSSSSTSPYNWTYVFRPKDATKANRAASMCEKAIANNAIGYNSHGETAYGKDKAMTKLAKAAGYDLGKITTKCGLSCGDLICLCNHWAGLSTCYIGSGLQLANNLKKNSNFTCLTYKKGMALKRGDTIITAHSSGEHNHVAMVL